MRMRPLSLFCALAACLVTVIASADPIEFKIATLAPRGSAWANILTKGSVDLETKTAGRVKIRYFFSGQQGDEKDVVRKIKLGQLDGAALTGIGLGLLQPEVRILDLPFLFKSDKQLDFVRDRMAADFEKSFLTGGYVLLGWGDVGWVHLYSAIPLAQRTDINKTKMWAWGDDPIAMALFDALQVTNTIKLGVPDVLPSLSTGKIDACYGSPLAAVALQWYTKVKFATEQPISYSSGAFIVRADVFNKLSADDQKALKEGGKLIGDQLKALVRKDNERAKNAMKKSGITFTATPAAFVADLEKSAVVVWDKLVGKLYSRETLAKVKALLAQAPK